MLNLIKKISLFFLDIVETGVIALSIFVIAYLFVIQPHEVKGNSMYPSFENGEFLLTDKISYRFKEPQRGEVIVFKAPLNTQYDYIKRIIGLPGDTIMTKDGQIYINQSKLEENYLSDNIYNRSGHFLQESQPYLIPEKNYFVMGDNRDHSSDSRDWGIVPKDNIIGKVWLRYWPIDRFGKIPKVVYDLTSF